MKEMINKYKRTLIISSLVILLPMFFGIMIWEKLPVRMATNWGFANEPNGFSSKAFAVLGIPIMLVLLQWLCVYGVCRDPKRANINEKMMMLMLWIVPCTSVLTMGMCYAYALGKNVNIGLIVMLFLSVLFMVIGNYLPKCKQTNTMGIRVKWTLADAEVWSKTHRLAGVLWVIGGIAIFVMSFNLEKLYLIVFVIMLIMCVVPIGYSYILYKNKFGK